MSNFSSIVKNLRISRGITQEQLASMLKISRSTIGMYETGSRQPDFEMLEALADIFNVDMDYLLGRSSVERKHPLTPSSPLTPQQAELLSSFDQLNSEGQQKTIDYASDLVLSGRYKKHSALSVDPAKEA